MPLPEIKSAINEAKSFLTEVMDDIKDVRFEGLEIDPNVNDSWLLTFSIYREPVKAGELSKALSLLNENRLQRSFVNVIVDSELKVHSVKPVAV